MLEGLLQLLKRSPDEGLTHTEKRLIAQEVERHLKNLPVETYQAINATISHRVEEVEKRYKAIAWVAGGALALGLAVFFNITAANASKEVTRMLAESEAGKKVEDLKRFHQEGADTHAALKLTATNVTTQAAQLTSRLAELERIDNVVRYSADGNLYIKSADGSIGLERRDGRGAKGFFGLYAESDFLTFQVSSNRADFALPK
jgi:hypothetical protein